MESMSEEEIKNIEDEIQKTPYNKATQKHIGMLKAKLAKLKAAAAKKGGGGGLGYALKKTGDATVILLGFPSVGKSTLLNSLTNAKSKVGAYAFTTLTVVPGMLDYRGAKIQLLDIPGIIEQAAAGKGRGKEVLSVVRSADLLLILVAGEDWKEQQQIIEEELYTGGFRINQHPPDVKVTRKPDGGIRIETTKKLELARDTIKEVLREFRVTNGEILIREKITLDQLIDCLARNRKYVPALFVMNKADQFSQAEGVIKISAKENQGIEELQEQIWEALQLKRIYLKKPGKEPDKEEPLIMRGSISVEDVCKRVNLWKHFAFARLWGPSARFPGQKKGADFLLQDADVVEIHHR